MYYRLQSASRASMRRRQLAFNVVQIEHEKIAMRTNRIGIGRAPEMLNHRDPVASTERELPFESSESIDQRRHAAQKSQSVPPRSCRKALRMTRQGEAHHLDV